MLGEPTSLQRPSHLWQRILINLDTTGRNESGQPWCSRGIGTGYIIRVAMKAVRCDLFVWVQYRVVPSPLTCSVLSPTILTADKTWEVQQSLLWTVGRQIGGENSEDR